MSNGPLNLWEGKGDFLSHYWLKDLLGQFPFLPGASPLPNNIWANCSSTYEHRQGPTLANELVIFGDRWHRHGHLPNYSHFGISLKFSTIRKYIVFILRVWLSSKKGKIKLQKMRITLHILCPAPPCGVCSCLYGRDVVENLVCMSQSLPRC